MRSAISELAALRSLRFTDLSSIAEEGWIIPTSNGTCFGAGPPTGILDTDNQQRLSPISHAKLLPAVQMLTALQIAIREPVSASRRDAGLRPGCMPTDFVDSRRYGSSSPQPGTRAA